MKEETIIYNIGVNDMGFTPEIHKRSTHGGV